MKQNIKTQQKRNELHLIEYLPQKEQIGYFSSNSMQIHMCT